MRLKTRVYGIMDNASIHHVKEVIENQAREKLLYLPLYLPDVSLLKKYSAKLKAS